MKQSHFIFLVFSVFVGLTAIGQVAAHTHAKIDKDRDITKVLGSVVNNKTPAVKKSDLVNINQADVKTLAKKIKGLGRMKAKAIVSYRQKHGKFKSIDDLAKVTVRNKPLGARFVKKLQGQIRLN